MLPPAPTATWWPTTYAADGLVCSVDHLASSAGAQVLAAGGSAADAAIAASAVLTVTSPHLCGLGGDLFALVHHRSGPPDVLNASGRAGSGADPERLRAEGHREMPFKGDVRSAPVPGCVDGWCALHERHGRLPLADVLAPAHRLAEGGFPAAPMLAFTLDRLAGVEGCEELTAIRPAIGERVRRPGVAWRQVPIVGSDGGAPSIPPGPGWSRGPWGYGRAMSHSSTKPAAALADASTSNVRRHAVAPPAVVRGWLYDSVEHWWALLVGAPPRSLV